MSARADGFETLDLEFLGQREVIATALLHGPDGVAIVDPGPSTSWPALTAHLASRGIALSDVRAVLATHIHLDHAGVCGLAAEALPNAVFFVHARGTWLTPRSCSPAPAGCTAPTWIGSGETCDLSPPTACA